MSDRMAEFMKASAEGAKAKIDWLMAHDAQIKKIDRSMVRLRWALFALAGAVMLLSLHAAEVI